MKKMIIKEIDGYNYILKNSKEKEYKINIEFYGIENKPKINDVIYINEKMLYEIDNKIVSFGPIDEEYGKNINSNYGEDIICLVIKNKKIYLKRFYG